MIQMADPGIKEEIMDLEPDEIVECDPGIRNFEFVKNEVAEHESEDNSDSNDSAVNEDFFQSKLPGELNFGGVIDCAEHKLHRSASNKFWQEKHANAFEQRKSVKKIQNTPKVTENEGESSENLPLAEPIPPRPPRLKAPKVFKPEDFLGLVNPEEYIFQAEVKRSVRVGVEKLATILKMALQPPWKIIKSASNLQVVLPRRLDQIDKQGCTLTISPPSKLIIYINDQRLGERHSFWKSCRERKILGGQLRIAYILEVISKLAADGITDSMKNVFEGMPKETRRDRKIKRKPIMTMDDMNAEMKDISIDPPKGPLSSNDGRKIHVDEIIALMKQYRGPLDDKSLNREIEFVKDHWFSLIELYRERLNYGVNTNMSPPKIKERFKRTYGFLLKWTDIVNNNLDVLYGILPREIGAEWNEYCTNDEYTLRSELARNVRKLRTLRLYVKTRCATFWNSLLMTSPKLNFICS